MRVNQSVVLVNFSQPQVLKIAQNLIVTSLLQITRGMSKA